MNPREEEKRWLSLGVGQTLEKKSYYSRSKAITVRVCHFCKREFYSPQALGGHQNAHRKEKDAARRRFYARAMQPEFQINRTLGVHLHSHPSKANTTSKAVVVGVGESCALNNDKEAGGSMWSGSLQLDSQPSDEHALDLTLKL